MRCELPGDGTGETPGTTAPASSATHDLRCTFCGAADLSALLDLPDVSGTAVRIFECAHCCCFVPDYFRQWQQGELQIVGTEHTWTSESTAELQKLLRDLQCMVGLLRSDLGAPGADNVVAEIGAGRGALLKALLETGYRAVGCEPSTELVALAREHYQLDDETLRACGADAFLEMLAERGIRPKVFVLWHVLEHLSQPLELLRKLVAACGPGGRLVLQVPTLATDYVFTQHYFFCTASTVSFVARELGLDVLRQEFDLNLLFLTITLEVPLRPRAAAPPLADRYADRAEPIRMRDGALRLKNDAIAAQARLLEERWKAMQQLNTELAARDELIRQKDQALAAQTEVVEERWQALQQMGGQAYTRDQLLAQQAQTLLQEREAALRLAQELGRKDQQLRQLRSHPLLQLLRTLGLMSESGDG